MVFSNEKVHGDPGGELLAVGASKGKGVGRMGRKWSPKCRQREVNCGKERDDSWRESNSCF